jgi:hypothetical protein
MNQKKGRSMDVHPEGATNTTFAPGRHKPSRRHCMWLHRSWYRLLCRSFPALVALEAGNFVLNCGLASDSILALLAVPFMDSRDAETSIHSQLHKPTVTLWMPAV